MIGRAPPRRRPRLAFALALAVFSLPASRSSAEPPSEAARHHDRGIQQFLSQDYAGAAYELSRAYALEPRRATLFAWAQAERLQGNCPVAVELYERYLDRDPPASQVLIAREHIARCRRIVRPPWYTDVWGDLLAGSGVATLGVGISFGVVSVLDDNRRESVTTYSDYVRLTDEARRARTISMVTMGAGVVLIAAGVLRYVYRSSGAASARPVEVSAIVGPLGEGDAFGFGVAGRF